MDEHLIRPHVSAAILVGGASSRMGRPKPLLEVAGRAMLDRVTEAVSSVTPEITVVAREPLDYLGRTRHRIVKDLVSGRGPLAGLATALFFARTDWVLLLACDLPLLRPALLAALAARAKTLPQGPAALVPRRNKGWEPLLALYNRRCLKMALGLLEKPSASLRDLAARGVRVEHMEEAELKAFDPELVSFTNVNTPGDLDRAEVWLGQA